MNSNGNGHELSCPTAEQASDAWLSEESQALFARVLSDLIQVGVPILQCLSLCSEVFYHPRLRYLLAKTHEQVREGNSFISAWSMYAIRGGIDPKLTHLVNIGEETGELDVNLRQYADQALNGRCRTVAQAIGRGALLVDFINGLSTLMSSGLPLVRSLQILEDDPLFAVAKEEIASLSRAASEGGTLASGLKKLEGEGVLRPDKVMIGMVECGERGEVLDVIIGRLNDQSKPAR